MTTWQLLASSWEWYPSVLVGCAALLSGYLAAARRQLSGRAWFFAGGVLVLLLALVSPLDALGDDYLFSAHMLQHMLLMLVVPPLLLLGTPSALARRTLEVPIVGRSERVLRRPFLAFVLGMGTEAAWHLPALYNAALANENIHIVEHLCFLVAGTIFWWPVLMPLEERRVAPLGAVLYFSAAVVFNTILGIVLVFAPLNLYPAYLEPADPIGALTLLRDGWGLTPLVDRQLGGLLMWLGGAAVFLPGIIGALARWYSMPEEEEQQSNAHG
jgi:putative membrane protein